MELSKQQIKFLRSLQQKKFRDESKLYVVEGIKMVNEAILAQPENIELLCYSQKSTEKILLDKMPAGVDQVLAKSDDMARISSQKNPQEAVALMKMPKAVTKGNSKKSELIFALDSIRDPGNMGTILRLADWFGIMTILCSVDSVDCFNPKVVQASMGAIFRIEVAYVELLDYLTTLKNEGVTIYGLSLEGKNIYTCELKKPAVIILGNEANGIRPEIYPSVDQRLLIPNYNEAHSTSESLNVAIAGAIAAAEFRRQLH